MRQKYSVFTSIGVHKDATRQNYSIFTSIGVHKERNTTKLFGFHKHWCSDATPEDTLTDFAVSFAAIVVFGTAQGIRHLFVETHAPV